MAGARRDCRRAFPVKPASRPVRIAPRSTGSVAGRDRRALLPDDLDQLALGPSSVELAAEDLLPRPEIESAPGDRHDHLAVHERPSRFCARIRQADAQGSKPSTNRLASSAAERLKAKRG